MPEPSHSRSKSHWDASPRPSPVKSTGVRSSSPLFRFVRSSSPTFASQSPGASESPSPTKSLHRYTHAPTFVQRFFGSTTQLDGSSLEIPLTEHSRGARQRATSDVSKDSLDPSQISQLESKLPTDLRNRRRSASLPSPGNVQRLLSYQPGTPTLARPKRSMVAVQRESPISMYSVQDDPFRYSAGPAGLSTSPVPAPRSSRADPTRDPSPSSSSTAGLEKTDSPNRARAKSSPNLLIPLKYGSRDYTAPLKLPKRSQSGKLEKPRSSSRQNDPPSSPSSAFPTHLSFQPASPTSSLRTAVALPSRKSSREMQSAPRKVLAPLDLPRPPVASNAPNMTFPLLEAETSTRRIVASSAPPNRQAATQDPGLSRHIRPMLSQSSSDAKSFDIIARYNSPKSSTTSRRTLDSTNTTSFLDLSPGNQKPTTVAQPSPRQAHAPRSAVPIPGRSANSKAPRPKLHPGVFDVKEVADTSGGSPGRLILDHSVYSGSDQRSARPALPTSLSDESFGNTTLDSMEEEEAAGDLASDKMSTSSSTTSLGSPILDTTLLKDARNVQEREDSSAPWLSVTPPSPVKDPSKRRGFIYRSSLMPPPYVHRSPSPEPDLARASEGVVVIDQGKGRQVDEEDVTVLPADSDDEDAYSPVSEALERYFDAADSSAGTIKPDALSSPTDETGITSASSRRVSPEPRLSASSPHPRSLHTHANSSSTSLASSHSGSSYYQTPMSTTLQLSLRSPSTSSISITFANDSPPASPDFANAIALSPALSKSAAAAQNPPPVVPGRSSIRTPSPSASHLSFIPSRSSPLASTSSLCLHRSSSSSSTSSGSSSNNSRRGRGRGRGERSTFTPPKWSTAAATASAAVGAAGAAGVKLSGKIRGMMMMRASGSAGVALSSADSASPGPGGRGADHAAENGSAPLTTASNIEAETDENKCRTEPVHNSEDASPLPRTSRHKRKMASVSAGLGLGLSNMNMNVGGMGMSLKRMTRKIGGGGGSKGEANSES